MLQKMPKSLIAFSVLAIFFLAGQLTVYAQTTEQPPAAKNDNSASSGEEYKIGFGDVINVAVSDAPEFNGRFRVSEAGLIEMIGVPEPIRAEGLTDRDLSLTIRDRLIDSKQLRDPKVRVYIEEYHGRTISVVGAVAKPAVYSLQKRTTVLEAISMAGGPLPNAGGTITVIRGKAAAEATGTEVGSVQIIDMNRAAKGESLVTQVEVKNGDVVSVSASQIVYVVGAVKKPGGYVMNNPTEGVSVVQAVALAEGMYSTAATHRGLIVRQSTSDHGRQEIPVDIALMMTGKSTDVLLAPNDILFIPESGSKKTLKAMGEFAVTAATGILTYGLGYRLGYGAY
ncbi:MAG TPA: SLBB domain-containing protein [Candidatus Acidoferrum sp.]|nr:SLBB domain-containing protein [Candidatus Acidoferrum sp.]